jgi:serine/threonine protein kinase
MLDQQVGSYRITQKLAQGGMGEVYLAQHELMDREAVVKVLHPKLLHDEEVVQRFLNEAKAAASIHHPGIVAIYDLGRAGGQVYIVMERLRGETLAERIAREPLDVEHAVAMIKQLASALAAAHALNIVHRDLKPENIFVVADPDMPGGERIKILDFGVAKLAPTQGGGGLTAQGSIFGTPAYMAPEQCENAAMVDQRTDLYALGCILYEMLCGIPPFGKGGLELLAAHLRDEPPRPTRYNRHIPEDLERTILQLLAKKPQHRLQSCEELLKALGAADLAPRSAPMPAVPVADLALANTVLPNSQPSIPVPGDEGTGRVLTTDRAYNVVALSPTTHRRATGQVEGITTSTQRPRKPWLWLGLGLLVAATGAYALMTKMSRVEHQDSAAVDPGITAEEGEVREPERPEQALLAQAEKAIEDMQWVDAMAAAQQVAAMTPTDSEAHLRAETIKELARQGQTYAVTYETFMNAVDRKDVHTAVYLREQLPADSVFRDKSQAKFEKMRDEWMAPRLKRAREYVDRKQCSKLAPIEKELGYLFPESAEVMGALQEACRSKKPAASQPGEGEGKPAEAQGDTPAEADKPDKKAETGSPAQDGKEAEGKPAEGKPAEGKPAEGKPAETAEEGLPDKVPGDEIRKRLQLVQTDLMKCYRDANLEGRVVVNFKISQPGRAGMVTSEPDEAGDAFRRCVWDTLRTIDFSRARNATEVSYPLGRDARKRPKTNRKSRR